MARSAKLKTTLGAGVLTVTLVGSLVAMPGAAQAQGHHGGHGGGHGFHAGHGGGHGHYGGHGRSHGYGGFGHGHRYYNGYAYDGEHGHYRHRRSYYGAPVAAGLIGGLALGGLAAHSPYYGAYDYGYAPDYGYGY
ncbi:hypothetical protein MetexDRAFT_1636 [Methylorubrum extorquens DSM 13060]|uniref:Transmembrane protein n=2 Tax=Methylorubrum extorquens TaxID=408 RepID=H1KG74_METEX|nr:hypothetical protein MetexDRAFT_1636 [Methylorubrum extorquens DSM 13060]